ncbi:hypothetical protein ABZ154_15195 [Streptomyces sp. NPDC006261]|uniref:hypothetical protein n=1 Tax=Streptomyces sp. NPDC006261 TaxID=3156739 RepID=UPI0033A82C49
MNVIAYPAIRFEDPPETYRDPRSRPHFEIAKALRERSGEWGIVATATTIQAARSLASQIRNASLAAYDWRSFDAVASTVGDEHRVYARHTGGAA